MADLCARTTSFKTSIARIHYIGYAIFFKHDVKKIILCIGDNLSSFGLKCVLCLVIGNLIRKFQDDWLRSPKMQTNERRTMISEDVRNFKVDHLNDTLFTYYIMLELFRAALRFYLASYMFNFSFFYSFWLVQTYSKVLATITKSCSPTTSTTTATNQTNGK